MLCAWIKTALRERLHVGGVRVCVCVCQLCVCIMCAACYVCLGLRARVDVDVHVAIRYTASEVKIKQTHRYLKLPPVRSTWSNKALCMSHFVRAQLAGVSCMLRGRVA